MYRIPEGYLKATREHAVNNCANYHYEEGCLVHQCPCLVAEAHLTIICKYFKQSVLPLNHDLQTALEAHNGAEKFRKVCKVCERKFESVTRNQQMCGKCQKKSNAKRCKVSRTKKRAK